MPWTSMKLNPVSTIVIVNGVIRTYCVIAQVADVIPLHVNGTVDVDLSKFSASEITQSGISNLWSSGQEGPYAIRHGQHPVNDFGQWKSGGSHR